jgi:uncharacterized protein involved in cysteine biosynthesis
MIGLRLMLLSIALNLLALPIYALVPGINLFVFLGLNGYLFGREYFEVVALRRLDIDAARAMRHRYGGRVFLGGVVIGEYSCCRLSISPGRSSPPPLWFTCSKACRA